MNVRLISLTLLAFVLNIAIANDEVIPGNAENGRLLWTLETTVKGDVRSCSTCHTADPRQPGKHTRTGKPIKPLSPSINPASLTDLKKINKWFHRNCKWTLGRVCTAQEKADVLAFLRSN
ncbi:MAG: DUF1924 domain-containing protein [Gammaproteobacteria bacterium]|nr:DUF1924 domain-containing protein [Gammaproteobacteria bacterium]